MHYGGAVDVAVICGLPPPLLLGVYSGGLLTHTSSSQRGPLEAQIAPVACSQSRSYDRWRNGKFFLYEYTPYYYCNFRFFPTTNFSLFITVLPLIMRVSNYSGVRYSFHYRVSNFGAILPAIVLL